MTANKAYLKPICENNVRVHGANIKMVNFWIFRANRLLNECIKSCFNLGANLIKVDNILARQICITAQGMFNCGMNVFLEMCKFKTFKTKPLVVQVFPHPTWIDTQCRLGIRPTQWLPHVRQHKFHSQSNAHPGSFDFPWAFVCWGKWCSCDGLAPWAALHTKCRNLCEEPEIIKLNKI